MSITLRLLVKVCRGESLSRRERQLLTRTTSYIFRDVPGALMFGVPVIRFLLPVFLKLFPNMSQSTFQDKPKEQRRKRKLKARIEFAKFLQDTAKEMDQVVKVYWNGGHEQTAEDFFQYTGSFLSGRPVSKEKFLCFANLFNNRITLDNISRHRLVNMCKYMGITAYGTDEYLRFMLRERLRSIKEDDKLIQKKGVESLSEAELYKYCRERGICAGEEMRQQLRDWLYLSVNYSVPSSLLILSRAFTVIGKKPVEVLLDTLRSLPCDLIYTVGTTSLRSKDPLLDKLRKFDFLDLQKKRIKKEDKELLVMKQSDTHNAQNDVLKGMTNGAPGQARARAVDEQAQLCELNNAMAVLDSALNVYMECEKILRLVNDENHTLDKMGAYNEDECKEEPRDPWGNDEDARFDDGDKVTSVLTDKVDAMVKKFGKEFNYVDSKIERYCDGKISVEVVAAVASYLKDSLDKKGIQELICNHSKYKEEIAKLGTEAEDGSADDAL